MLHLPRGYKMAFEILEEHTFKNDGTIRESLAKAKLFDIEVAIGWEDVNRVITTTVSRVIDGNTFEVKTSIDPSSPELVLLLRTVISHRVRQMIDLRDKMMIESRGYQFPMYLDRRNRILVPVEDECSYLCKQAEVSYELRN